MERIINNDNENTVGVYAGTVINISMEGTVVGNIESINRYVIKIKVHK